MTRRAYALTAGLVVAILAGGWFGLVRPQVADANAARDGTRAADTRARSLQVQLAMLRAQVAGLTAQQQRLQLFRQRMPETPALPALVRDLQVLAAGNGVQLVALAPGTPLRPGSTPAPASPAPSSPAPAGSPPAAGATPPAVDATPPAGSVPSGSPSPVPPPVPVPGAPGAYLATPLTMTVTGTYFAVESFLTALETIPRALLFTSVSLTPMDQTVGTTSAPVAPTPAPSGTGLAPGTPSPGGSASASASADPAPTAPELQAVLTGFAYSSTLRLPSSTPATPAAPGTRVPSPVPTAPAPSPSDGEPAPAPTGSAPTPAPTGSAPGTDGTATPAPAPPSGANALGPPAGPTSGPAARSRDDRETGRTPSGGR